MFKPALNITEQIADHLAEQIIMGQIGGGTRIQEVKLAKTLEVSRGSVREALLILERRHLIHVVPRKGAVVNTLTVADALEVIDMLAALQIRWFKTLLRQEHQIGWQCETERAVTGMEIAARNDDALASLRERRRFYTAILGGAGEYMVALFETLLPTNQRILNELLQFTDLDLHDVARYYRALAAALQSRDAARIVELVPAFGKRICGLTQRLGRDLGSAGDRSAAVEVVVKQSLGQIGYSAAQM